MLKELLAPLFALWWVVLGIGAIVFVGALVAAIAGLPPSFGALLMFIVSGLVVVGILTGNIELNQEKTS